MNFMQCFGALLILVIFNSACKFPDNTVDWQSINTYQPNKIQFGKTTVDEFKKLCPNSTIEKAGNDIEIFNTEPENKNKDDYKKIRVGFKNKKLDWLEFTLNKDKKIEMAKFVRLYDSPRDINTRYSDVLDYYDYVFFNISTDKDHSYAKSITVFEIPKISSEESTIGDQIPDWQNLNTASFLNLKPGYTLETEFNKMYPDLKAYNTDKFDTTSIYTLDKELGRAKLYYKKIILTFNNGLLSWISLVPQNLSLENALKIYGANYTVESIDSKYDFYDFSNFIFVVDKVQQKIINIGIISTI
ncbi:MAG: hypothetical protein V2B14_04165 [bacterium]